MTVHCGLETSADPASPTKAPITVGSQKSTINNSIRQKKGLEDLLISQPSAYYALQKLSLTASCSVRALLGKLSLLNPKLGWFGIK